MSVIKHTYTLPPDRSPRRYDNLASKSGRTTDRSEKSYQRHPTYCLLDFTANAVPMDIWDPEYIKRAAKWRSRETVLYISDAIVKWNDYKKCKLISVGCCTVITENPNVPEAIAVRNYAKTVPLNYSEILDNMTNKIPDLSTIKNQMSVQQVKEKIADKQSFYALVNAFLSKLNIDGPAEVVSMRCWHCHRLKKREEDFCSNGDCLEKEPTFSSSFNIHVSLTDRTGTLDNVRLSGAAAERILGIDADSFLEKDEEELSQLKWKFLLEKWDMKIAVQEIDRMRPLVTLLSCEPASPQESSARGISMN